MTESGERGWSKFSEYWAKRGWLFNGQIVMEDDDTKNAWQVWQAAFEAGRGGWISADTLLQHRFFSTQCECGGQRGIGWPMYVAHVKSLPAPPDSGDKKEAERG